ncbi:MAG: hypothetical protein COS95_01095 [Ignavibacteriales bacterium CG07_land_8_20_14_0_80_59_12]|nr:MAG: hypothetical protein COS95_01095 [Ignavibacteriales bacterium CG07_land_8_20_14_0_80_59_12]
MQIRCRVSVPLFLLLMATLIVGTSSILAQRKMPLPVSSAEKAVAEVGKQIAPDPKLTLFRVQVHQAQGKVTLSGMVESVQARSAVLSAVHKVAKEVVDSIVVVPDARIGADKYGIVRVSVGNLRGMPDHTAEMVTQVLMGMVVEILRSDQGFYLVHAPDRYVGWIESSSIVRSNAEEAAAWQGGPLLYVAPMYTAVRSKPDNGSLPVSDVVTGCLLKESAPASDGWRQVALPDSRQGYIREADATPLEKWKASRNPTPGSIIARAELFMGVPYLWGGTSPKGLDCSGFVKTVYSIEGIALPRDADQQYKSGSGTLIDPGAHLENLKKGDLLFFGGKGEGEKPPEVTHVGIYEDSSRYIHCSGMVRINSFDSTRSDFNGSLLKRLIGVRRVLSDTK